MIKFRRDKNDAEPWDTAKKFEINDTEITTENIKKYLSDSSDVNYQSYYINSSYNIPVSIIFIDGLVNTKIIDDNILKPLTQETVLREVKNSKDIIDLIEHGTVYHASRKVEKTLQGTLDSILEGSVALVFDNEKKAITFEIKGYEMRAITEPTTENALKGAKDSFIEVLRVNTSLVRRKLRTPFLRIKETIVGNQTKTPVAVVYIENLTNMDIVNEVLKRLNKIDIDGVLTAGNIEEYIIDNKHTLFPQVMTTERTDKFCHNILDGRVGIIIDGLPVSYVVPVSISMFYQAPEDYAQNYLISSFIRFLRYFNSIITLFLPGFYVAITTFHQEMIPSVLAVSIIKSKTEVPFPTVTSVFMMLIAFEILLEAGLRLPRAIGQAVTVIGALVVGQAAVQAKLISPTVVIIIAVTGISGFTMPNQDHSNALRIMRLVFVIAASIAGLYGLSLAFIVMIYHLNTIETFGVPYFTPFAANEGQDIINDTLIRMPLYRIKKRPSILKTANVKRQK